ncbi:hypothetical protein [Actinomadura harenae]|uniref:hypothetical protein n=1 Tax=Actinomadura harenae TaxID=2483351 RepID=UPI000EFCA5E9|nr:hypothetical protein [Actinomadura harenae]
MRIRRSAAGRAVRADVEDHHLGRLAWTLAEHGWMTSSRPWERPRLLRVFHPLVPHIGESVRVHRHRARLFFFDSSGHILGSVRRLERVVAGLDAQLEPCRLVAQTHTRTRR